MEVVFRKNQAPPVLRFSDTEPTFHFDAQLHGKDIRTHELLMAGRIIACRLSHARPKHANPGPASRRRSLSSVDLADSCVTEAVESANLPEISDQFIRHAIRKVVLGSVTGEALQGKNRQGTDGR